ncbi:RNA polymerase sigma-70 factor [Carboxylicivirga taeanensis]|uniref:RNA polymerase sigma-70 factor n=1 Tax=Carboxylicivirga taeanensis TaxID=1416875 RepID=UPI003F6DC44E
MNQIKPPQINNGNIERQKDVYEYLFNHYYARLCAYALRYVERKDYAEDVVSDTFFKMWQRGTIEISSTVQGYLFRAVYNNCMDFLRHRNNRLHKHQVLPVELENDASMALFKDFSEQDSLIIKEIEKAIEEAINKLPPQAKTVFVLKRHHGLKNKEIAEQLNIAVKTVEMHMSRALAFLRNELKEYCPFLLAICLL